MKKAQETPFLEGFTQEKEALFKGEHSCPHAFLGLHPFLKTKKIIRLFRPHAQEIFIELKGKKVALEKVDPFGLFEKEVPLETSSLDYKVYLENGCLAHDPFNFSPFLGEVDLYLFGKGVHYRLYEVLGGRKKTHEGVDGVSFAVWAPNAKRVSVVGDFNHWNGLVSPMRCLGNSGIYEIFIPGLTFGEKYKFEILTKENTLLVKADPYALQAEERPKTASLVADPFSFTWDDKEYLLKREKETLNRPINIYEVHLGSWKKEGENFLNYREIAPLLASYCLEMGYTHVEFLPLQEHPLDESWGYQVSGFYAVTSRFGRVQDFQYLVNFLHKKGIGIILDWVPGHFPTDLFSLGRFDGTALYEHEDPRKGFHPHWQTFIFNLGRFEVVNFLIANALFWFHVMHIDGLRVDAVASMLYLDYGRSDGCWIANSHGGKENLEAIQFFKHFNSVVHAECKGVLTIAEESTSFPQITHSLLHGGLGFDLKWNMGWMNDTLRYFAIDPLFRKHHQNDLTFGLLYAFSEKFCLVLSHDEVVHGKKSLISKMPGDMWQQFAHLRLLLSYTMTQPGKKLFFMGAELAEWNEWNVKKEREWHLLTYPTHQGVYKMVQTLNHLYLNEKALWEKDFTHEGFEWVDFSDRAQSVISYLRKGEKETLFIIHNFTPLSHERYTFHFPFKKEATLLFNSDDADFGGSGFILQSPEYQKKEGAIKALTLSLPPLSTTIYRV